jgi:hypothetical protein
VIRAKRRKIKGLAADSSAELGPPAVGGSDSVQAFGLVAAIAGLAAAWIAAGSTGLLATEDRPFSCAGSRWLGDIYDSLVAAGR